MQPHLQKLFDGIQTLEFEGEGRGLNVLAMRSAEGEAVPLASVVKARGAVESAALIDCSPPSCWLCCRSHESGRPCARCTGPLDFVVGHGHVILSSTR